MGDYNKAKGVLIQELEDRLSEINNQNEAKKSEYYKAFVLKDAATRVINSPATSNSLASYENYFNLDKLVSDYERLRKESFDLENELDSERVSIEVTLESLKNM
ncbi:hypothetical protein JOC34_000844 [Virgibacillus halotolerans]|uniref:hypothetical protein n=1 Tax=Virgibacillus halotolerans TaxID=1071053 RepID=UPI00195F402F|nr:hypothetical protein [Virgibacillus halotolerans]MBM7598487.1 hypothetical protein [Virgibacillus halotolerans]